MSLRSFALFKRESAFYTVLDKKPHANFPQRLQSKALSGIVLPHFRSLEKVWGLYTKETRFMWIQQLLGALEWLEHLGYTHGDLKVQNMGIDGLNRLQLFDFGSIRHCNDEGYREQVQEDHCNLATCIHFLASGIDPFAKANSLAEVRQTFSILKRGEGNVDEAAKDLEEVIQAGWTWAVSSFSSLRKVIVDVGTNTVNQPEEPLSEVQLVLDHLVVEEDPQWMDEEVYRAAWKAESHEIPDDIWS